MGKTGKTSHAWMQICYCFGSPLKKRKAKTMKTRASLAGESVHPMLVHYPIALWTTSVITDLIFYFQRNTSLVLISKFLIAAGIVGAILAAIPGIIDWWTLTDPVVTKVANWHARLNIVALIFFSASLYLRLRHYGAPMVGFHLKIPFIVSFAGWVLMAISASLGGKLVYEHRLGVKEAQG
jgi:uncharacterized membrane protein